MRRTRTGKQLALTPRDLGIFRALAGYRYLRSTYLHPFAGGASETRFKERLGDLFHEGFIDRPDQQWEFAHARHRPAVHALDERGRRALMDAAGENPMPRTYLASAVHRQFAHALMICECLASIELAARERADLRFIPWAEILARAPAATRCSPTPFRIPVEGGALIPDGVFGLEYHANGKRMYRFFALEADRATMPIVRGDRNQSSVAAKLTGYREIIAGNLMKQHWGVSSLLVLIVTTGPERLRHMLEISSARDDGPVFLFKAVERVDLASPMRTLLTEPWMRATSAPLAIDKSG
jgi:hypothetical protein